jgi:hypothetical protein
MRTRTVADFAAALGAWRTPSVNHVCADVDGTIGWFAAGLVPIRPNWEGLLPVAGDGRFEWAGFLEADQLPREINPSKGHAANTSRCFTAGRASRRQRWRVFGLSHRSRDERPSSFGFQCAQFLNGLNGAIADRFAIMQLPKAYSIRFAGHRLQGKRRDAGRRDHAISARKSTAGRPAPLDGGVVG